MVVLQQPCVRFRKDPSFLLKYDAKWLVGLLLASAGMWWLGWTGLEVSLATAAVALPFLIYLSIFSHLVVHNAAHGNIWGGHDVLVGEFCGMFVGTRYAAWDILHQRHHAFPDDPVKDPHPVEPSYWSFVFRKMILNLEPNLQQQYLERFGDTPRNRLKVQLRSALGVVTTVALALFWWLALGSTVFFLCFLPATVFSALFVAHFNWVTHEGLDENGVSQIRDLDTGYYWVANRILFGIYMHATHHKNPRLFNPVRATVAQRAPAV